MLFVVMYRNKIIAHRGDFSVAPENTMQAIQAAYDHGADGIEIDIRKTKDNQLVVFHDASIQRLAPKEYRRLKGKNINECTYEELKSVVIPFRGNILGPFPKGGYLDEQWYYEPQYRTGRGIGFAHILLFEDLIQWILTLRRKDFFMEVEFKELGLMDEVMKLLEKYQVYDRCILFSGEKEIIEEIQDYFHCHKKPHSLRLGANIRKADQKMIDFIHDMDLYEVGLNEWCFNKQDVYHFIDNGIQVFSNLGDIPEWWDYLSTVPVEGFKTNCMNDYIQWRRKK